MTEVVDNIDDCPEPGGGGGRVESGDSVLCIESHLMVDHCYVIPEHEAAITSAGCETPGSARVEAIFAGEDETGENSRWTCPTDYFLVFGSPQMVVCVTQY